MFINTNYYNSTDEDNVLEGRKNKRQARSFHYSTSNTPKRTCLLIILQKKKETHIFFLGRRAESHPQRGLIRERGSGCHGSFQDRYLRTKVTLFWGSRRFRFECSWPLNPTGFGFSPLSGVGGFVGEQKQSFIIGGGRVANVPRRSIFFGDLCHWFYPQEFGTWR